MNQTVRSIALGGEPGAAPKQQIPSAKLRFLLRKLSLRRGQTVVVIGTPEIAALHNLMDCVGDSGRVQLLLTEEQLQWRTEYLDETSKLCERFPQLSVSKLGPTLESQRADAVVLMPDRLMPPYEPIVEQAWRRLVSGGRLMLVLSTGDEQVQRLYELIDVAAEQGFVSRYRRVCDKHTAWVGVKYSNQ